MIALRLSCALAAVIYGIFICTRHKQPLFLKIVLYGMASHLLGTVFLACYALVYHTTPSGFHVGYFGHIGAYFFLLSSYYGAMDRLADGGEKAYRRHRAAALAAPLALLAVLLYCVLNTGLIPNLPLLLFAIPMGGTLFFALKHALLPDVELGIIRVMRPYNLAILLFCLFEALPQLPFLTEGMSSAARGIGCLLLLVLLPVAERGVRKWLI